MHEGGKLSNYQSPILNLIYTYILINLYTYY